MDNVCTHLHTHGNLAQSWYKFLNVIDNRWEGGGKPGNGKKDNWNCVGRNAIHQKLMMKANLGNMDKKIGAVEYRVIGRSLPQISYLFYTVFLTGSFPSPWIYLNPVLKKGVGEEATLFPQYLYQVHFYINHLIKFLYITSYWTCSDSGPIALLNMLTEVWHFHYN